MAAIQEDKSNWVIGGTIVIGLGLGLIFVHSSPILLSASLFIGIGVYW